MRISALVLRRYSLGIGVLVGVCAVRVFLVVTGVNIDRQLLCRGKAELHAELSVLFSEFLVDFHERRGLFFASEATEAGALAILEELVLCAGKQFAHALQVADLHKLEVDAEAPYSELARVAVGRLLEALARRSLVLALAEELVFELGQNVRFIALAEGANEGEAIGQVGKELCSLA